MKGHRIGYVRVSSFDQNPERQLDGVGLDKVFTDKTPARGFCRLVRFRAVWVEK